MPARPRVQLPNVLIFREKPNHSNDALISFWNFIRSIYKTILAVMVMNTPTLVPAKAAEIRELSSYSMRTEIIFPHFSRDIVGGPHFSNLPDGLLAAVARSLHRCLDIFVNKPIIVGTDIVFATKLIKALIIISRNVDNLGQLSSSSSVGDSLAIANTFLLDEFAAKVRGVSTKRTPNFFGHSIPIRSFRKMP